jgi:MFS transporter, FHS family, Na+ dependent glucose transporter 1
MNALHMCFGVGAMFAPIVVSQTLVHTGSLTAGYVLIAGACLVMAGLIARRPSPENPHVEGARGFPTGVTRLVVLAVGFFVAYAWLELGFASWIFTYGRERGLDERRGAAWLTTGFWAAFTLGRLIAIPLSAVVKPWIVMIADFAITGAGLVVLILGGNNLIAMWIGTVLVGLGVASLFPTMLSLSEPVIPSTSAVTSLFLVGASLGTTILPPVIGAMIERWRRRRRCRPTP